jgi:hypothetical protein
VTRFSERAVTHVENKKREHVRSRGSARVAVSPMQLCDLAVVASCTAQENILSCSLPLYAASSLNDKAGSEQIMVVGDEARIEICCGKDPRICEHVAQQTRFQTFGSS